MNLLVTHRPLSCWKIGVEKALKLKKSDFAVLFNYEGIVFIPYKSLAIVLGSNYSVLITLPKAMRRFPCWDIGKSKNAIFFNLTRPFQLAFTFKFAINFKMFKLMSK